MGIKSNNNNYLLKIKVKGNVLLNNVIIYRKFK